MCKLVLNVSLVLCLKFMSLYIGSKCIRKWSELVVLLSILVKKYVLNTKSLSFTFNVLSYFDKEVGVKLTPRCQFV